MSYYEYIMRLLKNIIPTTPSSKRKAKNRSLFCSCEAALRNELIIQNIIKFLPQPALKNLRLVNKFWGDVCRKQFIKLSITNIRNPEDRRNFYNTFDTPQSQNIYLKLGLCPVNGPNPHLPIFQNFSFFSFPYEDFDGKHGPHIRSLKIAIGTDDIHMLFGFIANMDNLRELHVVIKPKPFSWEKQYKAGAFSGPFYYTSYERPRSWVRIDDFTHPCEHLKVEFHKIPENDIVELTRILLKAFPTVKLLTDLSGDPHGKFLSACCPNLGNRSEVKVEYLGRPLQLIEKNSEDDHENQPNFNPAVALNVNLNVNLREFNHLRISKLQLSVRTDNDEGNPLSAFVVDQLDQFKVTLEHLNLVFNVGNAGGLRVLYVFPRMMAALRSLHLNIMLDPPSPSSQPRPQLPGFLPFVGMDNDYTYCINRFPKLEELSLKLLFKGSKWSSGKQAEAANLKEICENLHLLTGGECPSLRKFYCDVFKSLESMVIMDSPSQSIDKDIENITKFVGRLDKQFPNLVWIGTTGPLSSKRIRWEEQKNILNKLFVS